ncbi:type IV secretory system conjugative DNA transfer family protein [uncultured Cetobacterium sp.]|uniref:type IV secretory system conjugative DNA transfer family protein n=1 Tax=uncultured Cetobacterium sp. TaxID=527638 RepID=UPI0025DFABBC|nr:type IV secretory system conjugative DNA transfer family protein [uncultured Cetobacterium sp.]
MNKKTKKKISFIFFITMILVAFSGATQMFAYKTNFHPGLGKPLLVKTLFQVEAKLYNPFLFIKWSEQHGETAPVANNSATSVLFGVLIFSVLILSILNKSKKKLDSHGSADWATKDEIDNPDMGLLTTKENVIKEFKRAETVELYNQIEDEEERYSDGVVCGRDTYGRELRSLGLEHMIAMAPTRSGKGVGLVIPTLLTWKGSVFVLDIKNENFALTSKYREKIGQKIIRFAPTDLSSNKYNPLAEIQLGTVYEYNQAREIVEALITVNESDTFFGPTAVNFLTAVIIFVMYSKINEGKIACLRDVYRFLTSPSTTEEEKLKAMAFNDHITEDIEKQFEWDKSKADNLFEYITKDLITLKGEERPYVHPKVSRMGADMLGRAEKERSGIISSAKTNLEIFDTPLIGENTSSSDIQITDLMNGEKPISFYFVTPPKDLEKVKVLARILIMQIINKLTAEIKIEGKPYKHRLLLLIDEFPAIGKMKDFETSLAFSAGYGVKAFMITQSLNQLYSIYGKNNKIIDNCHIQIYYAPNDTDTPQMLEKKIGNKTVVVKNLSYKGMKYFSDWNYSESLMSRPLLYSAEISKLPKADSLIFVTGFSPIYGKKVRWYAEEKYINRQSVYKTKKRNYTNEIKQKVKAFIKSKIKKIKKWVIKE